MGQQWDVKYLPQAQAGPRPRASSPLGLGPSRAFRPGQALNITTGLSLNLSLSARNIRVHHCPSQHRLRNLAGMQSSVFCPCQCIGALKPLAACKESSSQSLQPVKSPPGSVHTSAFNWKVFVDQGSSLQLGMYVLVKLLWGLGGSTPRKDMFERPDSFIILAGSSPCSGVKQRGCAEEDGKSKDL
jgi:hypothetical protein